MSIDLSGTAVLSWEGMVPQEQAFSLESFGRTQVVFPVTVPDKVGKQSFTVKVTASNANCKFEDSYKAYLEKVSGWSAKMGGAASIQNEAVTMAGTILTILPLLIIYFCLQRYFTEAIDRSGITGE